MRVFVTGGTGYLGKRMIPALAARGHDVTALVRPGSEGKLAAGVRSVAGDPLDRATFEGRIAPADTFVQLVGTPHPSPAKAPLFLSVDLKSVRESAVAAAGAGVRHFVYVSAAQPAPVMRAYVAARAQGEAALREQGLNATCLRPWYVLGPGHRWAYALLPWYWVAERLPGSRETALRLGLVTVDQMTRALVFAVEHPVEGLRAVSVEEIRRGEWATV